MNRAKDIIYMIFSESYNSDHFSFMPNIKPAESGLPYWTMIRDKDQVHNLHDATVKVFKERPGVSDSVSFYVLTGDIDKKVKNNNFLSNSEERQVQQWIRLNRDLILKYWYTDIAEEKFRSDMTKWSKENIKNIPSW